jgi:glycosyltransferase involved in cell wall biosynthesis
MYTKLNKKKLCFFTQSYPYGTGETFIENELNFIAPYFDVIYLFHKTKDKSIRVVPPNVKLIYISPPSTTVTKKGRFFSIPLLLYLVLYEILFSRQKKLFVKNFKYNVANILNCIYYAEQIKNNVKGIDLDKACFYSYWFFDWNLSLSILKFKNFIKNNYTRAHGFDVYEYTDKPNYLPLRAFCFKNTNKVFTICQVGKDYLSNLYPKFKDKIFCSYLGTKDYGFNLKPSLTSSIHFVSCSRVNDLKRLHLIIEILKSATIPIKWTHIGNGTLCESIKEKARDLPENIIVDFKGSLAQNEIFDFYLNTPIDFFINCSISEGLPVSIMEATSFGIPIIATDVGGTKEIVNSHTGILLSKNFDPQTVTKIITNFRESQLNRADFRHGVKKFWANHFEASKNYVSFYEYFISR